MNSLHSGVLLNLNLCPRVYRCANGVDSDRHHRGKVAARTQAVLLHDLLANIYLHKGMDTEAEQELERVQALNGDQALPLLCIALSPWVE